MLIIAALVGATGAAAQSPPPTPHAKAAHSTAHPGRRADRPAPLVIPQQFAPPQEAYASQPETADEAAAAEPSPCQAELAKIAVIQPLPTLVGPGECGASDAVVMEAIVLPDQGKVAVTPPATLRCTMAAEVARWVRDDVAPTLKNLPPLRALDNFASYDCRGRNNVRAAQMSEHGRADALDVRGFRLADGHEMELTDVHVAKDWREAIRATVCARFATVLGPGSDGYHEEHVHLDLEPRRNNYKICEWDVREPPPPVEAKTEPAKQAEQPAEGAQADNELPQVTPIPIDEVPLPRPRPLAANTVRNRSLK